MKNFDSQNDILEYTSEETGYSVEEIKEFEKHFWESIRYFLSHPLETKKGILISKFLKIFPKQESLYMAEKTAKVEFFKELFNEWKRQTEKGDGHNGE